MHVQEFALLDLEPRRDQLVQLLDRPGERLARGGVQRIDLVGRERWSLPKRQEARGPQDLVRIGIAYARDEPLVAQQAFQLPGVAADPLPPDIERERRIVRVRALLIPARDRT